ncbi:MAG: MaoC family dehydratase N-terminal domain-containing protein [Sphingomonas sp.]|jgi:3-methylfumaryl-CoA hydratase|uniref:FAS1-like dehydratase domain-containing protein n=1 Tax=Sphingomonas sp. TaxID=28214 RepID=UPI003566522B
MTIDAGQVAEWQSWVGRSEARTETLCAEGLRRYAAALGEDLDVERAPPSLAHWAFFLPVVAPDQLGPDGHPRRGGFLPPITLPRRMFAAADMLFHAPLRLGEPATRSSRIDAITHKAGRSGDLLLVDLVHEIAQGGAPCVTERQTIVYRDAGAPTPPVVAVDLPAFPDEILWQPRGVDLFRFSAVTFNSHRIHYDLSYATGEEGYPALVVHGPFTAARLFGLASRPSATPRGFAFRALAPLFVDQPVRLRRGDAQDTVAAIRCDGTPAMQATVTWRPWMGHGRRQPFRTTT